MHWKKQLKDCFKVAYAGILFIIERIFGIDTAKKFDVFLRFRKQLNLKNPQTLADKVSYIALHTLPDLAVCCTDKWEARRYVSSKGLDEILIPVYGDAVSKAEDVDFHALPERFVLKATHGCAMNYICKDKAALDTKACTAVMNQWLRTTYGTFSVEPHYRKLRHRIYCEAYLADAEVLMDYKIHCINGRPEFILACSGRDGGFVQMDIFDLNWQWLDAVQPYKGHIPGDGSIPKPQNLDKMIQIAGILSKDFDFVRVDLYEVNGQVYFGEMTFTPANGVFPSYKQDLLNRAGKKLKITDRVVI